MTAGRAGALAAVWACLLATSAAATEPQESVGYADVSPPPAPRKVVLGAVRLERRPLAGGALDFAVALALAAARRPRRSSRGV